VFDGKDYFTIVDFRGATNKFYDKDWDGEPEAPEPGGTGEPKPPPYTPEPPEGTDGPEPEPGEPKPRLKVKLGKHRELKVIDVETRYIDENGKPLTVQEFVERLITQLPGLFKSVEELRQIWSDPDERETLIGKLVQAGFDKEQLAILRRMFEAEDCDIFDLLAFLAFEQPMATRKARADQVRTNSAFFNQYQQEKAKQFLHFVLNRYEQTGSTELSRERLPALIELSGLGTVKDASTAFGGKPAYLLAAFKQLQQQLYHVN
ncbi:DEAD/DEAH box helicase, partial [Vibrio anguillarum]